MGPAARVAVKAKRHIAALVLTVALDIMSAAMANARVAVAKIRLSVRNFAKVPSAKAVSTITRATAANGAVRVRSLGQKVGPATLVTKVSSLKAVVALSAAVKISLCAARHGQALNAETISARLMDIADHAVKKANRLMTASGSIARQVSMSVPMISAQPVAAKVRLVVR
jgi:hypothetical protein